MKKTIKNKNKEPEYKVKGTSVVPTCHPSMPEPLAKTVEKFVKKISTEIPGAKFHGHGGMAIDSWGAGYTSPYEKVYDFPLDHTNTVAFTEFVSQLKKDFNTVMKSEYERGLRDGKNLLMQLNSGELSLSKFDGIKTEYDQ